MRPLVAGEDLRRDEEVERPSPGGGGGGRGGRGRGRGGRDDEHLEQLLRQLRGVGARGQAEWYAARAGGAQDRGHRGVEGERLAGSGEGAGGGEGSGLEEFNRLVGCMAEERSLGYVVFLEGGGGGLVGWRVFVVGPVLTDPWPSRRSLGP